MTTGHRHRTVLITGAAGGIGAATCRVFHDAGWQVIGVDKRRIEMPGVRGIVADISDPDAPSAIFEEVARDTDRLDALVNNAAVQICKPIIETTPEEWDLVMASNIRSVFLSVREAYPLLKRAQGSIINVSSVHAMATSRNIAAYAASKGALLAFTRSMALEFGEAGIRVNALLPGAVDTPMLHDGLTRGHIDADSVDGLVRGLGHKHVLGRVGTPEEIGRAVLFLADADLSSFMTGQSLVVDGGALARLSTE
ncbi:MAG: SDR family NAD(P)-dependent oxidoreductase [Phycisphaerales bacterium]